MKKYIISNKKGVLLVVCCIFFGFCYALYCYPEPSDFPFHREPILIAHAGGSIDGKFYTNSLEAVENSLKNNFNFIELDISPTPVDSTLVAVHDWKLFSQITGNVLGANQKYSYDDIAELKIHEKYTILSADRINELFSKHKSAWLVTDKIANFDLLLDQIHIPLDRMLVETFSYWAYAQALRKGINYPMLCIWNEKSLHKQKWIFYLKRIKIITVPASLLETAYEQISELYNSGVSIFAFSSNDLDFVKKHIGECVTGFYTDTLLPQNISKNAD